MSNKSITFVTSFFYFYEDYYDNKKNVSWRIDRFKELANTGIHLCIYVCPTFEKEIQEVAILFPNVKIMRTMTIQETWINQVSSLVSYTLPESKNTTKDVDKYMIIINSKCEFLTDTVQQNPFDSSHFAWIDFNISYVFSNKETTLSYLKKLVTFQYPKKCFLIPGCWNKYNNEYVCHITDNIYWRFCGGFFLGDKNSILEFDELYKLHFPRYLETYRKLIWEVNFWAWLEANTEWKPHWYWGDHNDSIIQIPTQFICYNLHELGSHQYQYNYPMISDYNASSASYIYYQGQHILNTRYVNYWYNEEGYYQYPDGTNIIRNKNICSILDKNKKVMENTEEIFVLVPMNYMEMKETIEYKENPMYSRNLEDIRLYSYGNQLKYIATNVGYYHTGGNRIMIGNYDIENHCYFSSQIIEPPTNTHCEKNWIPVVMNEQELFIYQWSPFQIGAIVENPENTNYKKLEIIQSWEETKTIPFFDKLRGSTTFIEYTLQPNDYLIGIAHFSEERKPRHYFHMMILLDKNTLKPVKYSDPFVFEKIGIEFCIGLSMMDNIYHFWISQMDRSPMLITLDIEKISIHNEIIYTVEDFYRLQI
jgi:hypothetical protein